MERYQAVWLKAHGATEKPFATDMERFLNKQAESVVRAAQGLTQPLSDALQVFDPMGWDDALRKAARPHLLRGAGIGADLELSRFDQQKDADPNDILIRLPERVLLGIEAAIDETLAESYWSDINERTRNRLNEAILESLREGYDLREQVAAIRRFIGPDPNRTRGILIARTESTGALNSGTYAVQEDLASDGLIETRAWLSTIDEHTRGMDADDRFSHVIMNGREAKIGEDFDISGEPGPYPGLHKLSAGNRAFCRCTTLSVIPETV